MAKIIICCAGSAERWKNHTGVPKHLAMIDGEPLIHRTVRELATRNFGELIVLAPNDKRYHTPEATTIVPQPTGTTLLPFTALGHSVPYWASDSNTVVLFGDVWFSEATFEAIGLACRKPHAQPVWIGRHGHGKSGHEWGELFATCFAPISHKSFKHAFASLLEIQAEKGLTPPGGWECYRFLNKIPPFEERVGDNFIDIDDETDDFDTPEQYDLWLQKWRSPQRCL